MKLRKIIQTLIVFIVSFNLSHAATVTGRAELTTAAGTEKVPIDDSGTDKFITLTNVWKGMVLTGGVTASGSSSFDLSGSSGTFKMPTGATSYGGSTNKFTNNITPLSNDGAALGTTALEWSDLFLASGGVINWANGDALLTHSSGVLTVAGGGAGDLRVTTAGTSSTSVVTISGTQTLTNKTLTSPTITGPTYTGNSTTTGTFTQTSANAAAFTSGLNGATNPVFKLINNIASQATGLAITGNAAAAGTDVAVISSGTNEALRIDAKGSGSISLNVTGTGNIVLGRAATGVSLAATGLITTSSPSAAFGYATGAGGAVTQATNRSTGVTMVPNPCTTGAITTTTTSLAGLASADFIVTDSAVAIGDTVVVSIRSGSNGGGTVVSVSTVAAGSFTIRVTNCNAAAGTAETGAIIINFAIIKGVSS